jgi:hypothetical protein
VRGGGGKLDEKRGFSARTATGAGGGSGVFEALSATKSSNALM